MTVLMIGATGEFAGLVLPELKKRGVAVRALVHNRQAEDIALQRGADEVVLGDLMDTGSLFSAVDGIDSVFLIIPAFASDEAKLGTNMVDAARAAGVRKIVFSGVIHPSLGRLAHHTAKLPVEEEIYVSGMTYAVLQPAAFMQNIEAAWTQIAQTGKYALPYSKDTKLCYVDYRDVAEAAAIALTSDKLDNGTFELCASGMLSRTEVAALMSEALGKRVEAVEMPFEQWAQLAHIPDGHLREGLERMFAEYNAHGLSGGNSLVLRAILEREPRTMKQYFAELTSRERKAA